MTDLKFMHSIESLRHIAERVKVNCEYHGITVRPTLKFHGTVKLHGTSGAVSVNRDNVRAMGRNRELTITSDNYGFAHFVEGRKADFTKLLITTTDSCADEVTFYGEWCGQGIQKKVAVASLPKMFVIFAVYNHTTDAWLDINEVTTSPEELETLNSKNIFLITQAPTFEVVIDFENPAPAAELISQYTLQVEDCCPFSAARGSEGMGEGIVWVSNEWHERLLFKSKGEKHKKGGDKVRVAIDPEKVADISALVDILLPEWRLEQGLEYLRENNIPVANTSTGEYLKWIAQDVLKEESDQIAANPYSWKEIQGSIMVRAKNFLFDELNAMAGLA